MAVNDRDFPGGQPSQDVKLAALGFDGSGHRGGGIDRPQKVLLPMNSVLLRLHKPVQKAGEFPGDFGAWWFTAFEYRRICNYFGVDGRALIVGRASGQSALHGVLALLKEWYGGSPEQLSYANAVRLKQPFHALYGPGAPANSDGYARTLKPARLTGGQPARQIYIHQCWTYQSEMERLLVPNASTDSVFGGQGGLPTTISSAPGLSFEV